MSKLSWLIGAMACSISANASAQSAAAEQELSRLVADCNGIAAPPTAKRRNIRACETLADQGRLALAEPATVAAYQRHQQQRVQACQRRQESPRGQSRGPRECR